MIEQEALLEQSATGLQSVQETWWAADDAPVRGAPHAAFLSAKSTIHVAGWGLSPDLLLVRGLHHRAGPDGSAKQEELLAWLRARGLSEQDLHFWQQCEELSVKKVLSYAVSKGIDVRVLLWHTYTLPFQANPDPGKVRDILEPLGIICLLDDSHMNLLNHPIAAHHHKTVVVDGRYAFVGGIDMMAEESGEFDRWDTKGHIYHHPLRVGKNGTVPHCWHDVHIRIQVTRTVPNRTYHFASEEGIAPILETYKNAFARAQRLIYIENQYFWRRTFLGLEHPTLGLPHPDMEHLFQTLAEALERGVIVTLILPDNPNVGREFTDDGIKYLWEIAPRAVAAGTLQAYTLATSHRQDDHMLYRPIYVHAKVAIVDDQWMTVGSANLNNRGMRDDTEMNVALEHAKLAQGLRILLMAEHLGLCDEDTLFRLIEGMGKAQLTNEQDHTSGEIGELWTKLQARLSDPFGGIALYAKQAKENLLAVKAGKPLVGHLLPYITHSSAQDYQVEVNPVNGWLDLLSKT